MKALYHPDLRHAGDTAAALDARFRDQARQFRLQFRCPDCVHVRLDGSCTLGWPNAHLLTDAAPILDARGEPQFCKAFEPA